MQSITDRLLEEIDHEDDGRPWADVILASLAVQLVTFAGVLVATSVSIYSRVRSKDRSSVWSAVHNRVIPSFAAGALLATTVFLIIPESLALLAQASGHDDVHDAQAEVPSERFLRGLEEETDHIEGETDHVDGESEAAWKFGAALLGGVLFPILLSAVFPPPPQEDIVCDECVRREAEGATMSRAAATETAESYQTDNIENSETPVAQTLDEGCDAGECEHDHSHDETSHVHDSSDDAQKAKVKEQMSDPPKHHAINLPLAASVLIGDGIHNFVDGVFIGNAFLLCSSSLAWTLVATTVYHEVAQEIADFALLTHHCNMPTWKALLANFLSGFSTLLGAIVILLFDLTNTSTGVILAISAGVYIYIAAAECIPRVHITRKSGRDSLWFLFWFALGAIPIGLVLLNHGHCEENHE